MSNTRATSDWENTVFVKSLADIKKIKKGSCSDLKVWGSSKLIQLLLKHDLVDELAQYLAATLGTGKKLFQDGTIPAAFTLVESTVTTNGVIMVNYSQPKVKTGTVGA